MKKKNNRILVTGSAGFMGCHLVDLLSAQGHDVYGVDDLSGGYLRNVHDRRRFKKLDLRDRLRTSAFIDRLKPDIVFHLAADATEGRSQFTPFSATDRNIGAYMNLLVPAIRNGLKKMVLTSSMSVYGKQQVPFREDMTPQPEDIYGISKASMEQVTRVMGTVYGFPYVIVRPHNVYGPRQNLADPYRNVVGIFINRLLHGKHFHIYGDGKQKRAFSYIDDVTLAMVSAAFSPKAENKIFNIGSDDPSTLKQLSQAVLKEFFPDKIPAKMQPRHLPDRPQEVKYAYSDHTQAKKLLGFEPEIGLSDGIGRMVAWARTLGAQKFQYLSAMELEHPKAPSTWKKKLI